MAGEKSWLDDLANLGNGEVTTVNTKEGFDKIEEELIKQRDEMRREQIEAGLNSESNKENGEESDLDKIDVEAYMEMMEEELSSAYLVRGALLKCSCGSHERKLNVLKDHGVYVKEKPLIHQLDKEKEKNITYFGVCNSDSEYLDTEEVSLELDIKDENGEVVDTENVKGKRCEPYIMREWMDTKKKVRIVDNGDKDPDDKLKDGNETDKGYPAVTMNSFLVCRMREWMDTKKKVRIVDNGDKDPDDKLKDGNETDKGYPAVTMNSFLVCRYGGLIEPLTSGQEEDEEDEDNQNVEEPQSEIEGTTEGTTETQDPERDKNVLSRLSTGTGTGIDLINDTDNYINHMSTKLEDIINDGMSTAILGGDVNSYVAYNTGIEFEKIRVDLYNAQQNNQLDNLTYEQTREIAEIVNKYVGITGVNEDIHYFRNVMNDLLF